MRALEFKSTHDGSLLSFEVMPKQNEEVDFTVLLKTRSFSGAAPASTYIYGPPSTMFREMANEWKGWKGEKTWNDLEGRVALAATSDSTGHISLAVELVDDDYEGRLRVIVRFEAGQLEGMANAMEELFR